MSSNFKALVLLLALGLSACANQAANTPDLPNMQPSPAEENQAKLQQALTS